jgi:SPP1 family predicted phage head-tail adaptor
VTTLATQIDLSNFGFSAGSLRHRISIQQQSATQDTVGQPIQEYSDFARVAAAIEPINGRELFMSQQQLPQVDTRILLRYRSGISANMRAVYMPGSIYARINYDIKLVVDVQMLHKWIVLICWSGVSING